MRKIPQDSLAGETKALKVNHRDADDIDLTREYPEPSAERKHPPAIQAGVVHDLGQLYLFEGHAFLPKVVLRVDHQDTIDAYAIGGGTKCVISTGAEPCERHIDDGIPRTHELDCAANVVDGFVGKYLIISLTRPRGAVADTGEIQTKDEVSAARPTSRQGNVHTTRADMRVGARVQQYDSATAYFAGARFSDYSEQCDTA